MRTSATTPTTVAGGPSSTTSWRPRGSSRGQTWRASDLLTTTTAGNEAVSLASKDRPARTAMPIAWK
jgi:hypothetical protein